MNQMLESLLYNPMCSENGVICNLFCPSGQHERLPCTPVMARQTSVLLQDEGLKNGRDKIRH